jgi:hypothetical protein
MHSSIDSKEAIAVLYEKDEKGADRLKGSIAFSSWRVAAGVLSLRRCIPAHLLETKSQRMIFSVS